MKTPSSPLQSGPKGHQKLVLEPLFLQGGGGTKLLRYGDRLSFSCEARDKCGTSYGSFRWTMELRGYTLPKFSKGLKRTATANNISLLPSKLCVTSSRPSTFPEEEEEEEDDDGYDGVDDDLSYFKGLVLDFSYRPINIVCWKRAICLEFLEKVDVLEYYDQTVSSPGGSFYIPAVLRVGTLIQEPKRRKVRVQISRKNILGRDLYTCQYCGSKNDLTIDHVLPVSRGGKWNWENLVTACSDCNSRKGHKTLEEADMKLIRIPKEPKDYYLPHISVARSAFKMLGKPERMPTEWINYVPRQFLRS